MRPLRILLLAALALLVAPAVATAGEDRVFFPGNCETNSYKPKTIIIACADGNFVLRKVKYSSYGESTARGTSTARVNDCEPNCGRGTFRNYAASFTLSRPRQCGDVMQFRRIVVRFTDERPEGFGTRTAESVPCSDAPS